MLKPSGSQASVSAGQTAILENFSILPIVCPRKQDYFCRSLWDFLMILLYKALEIRKKPFLFKKTPTHIKQHTKRLKITT